MSRAPRARATAVAAFALLAPALTAQADAPDGKYTHPRMRFSVELAGKWHAFDHRHPAALDAAIAAQAPPAGTPMRESRWETIYRGEREAVVDGQQGAYLLPAGDWLPEGSETRILISTRTLHCPDPADLRAPEFAQRLEQVLTSHHLVPGGGQERVLWEPLEVRTLVPATPDAPELATAILRGQVLRQNGQQLALYYQFFPGGDRFYRLKAVCRAEALPLVRPELERLAASFGGIAACKNALWAEFLRYLPIGAGILLLLLFLQQLRIRREAERERQRRRAAHEAQAGD